MNEPAPALRVLARSKAHLISIRRCVELKAPTGRLLRRVDLANEPVGEKKDCEGCGDTPQRRSKFLSGRQSLGLPRWVVSCVHNGQAAIRLRRPSRAAALLARSSHRSNNLRESASRSELADANSAAMSCHLAPERSTRLA
jgi:hypothetical protein